MAVAEGQASTFGGFRGLQRAREGRLRSFHDVLRRSGESHFGACLDAFFGAFFGAFLVNVLVHVLMHFMVHFWCMFWCMFMFWCML